GHPFQLHFDIAIERLGIADDRVLELEQSQLELGLAQMRTRLAGSGHVGSWFFALSGAYAAMAPVAIDLARRRCAACAAMAAENTRRRAGRQCLAPSDGYP